MTRAKTFMLMFAAMILLVTAVCWILASLDAGGAAYAIAFVLVTGLVADTSSRVVMHYGSSARRRR